MSNKILAALVAGGLLVGAGFVTSIVSAPNTAVAQEESTEDTERGPIPRVLNFLGEVLDGLVSDGTIDEGQAEAVLDAVETAVQEAKEERQESRELIKTLLEDGVITEDEASQLPEDHPFLADAFDEAWEDGELTTQEIREVIPGHRRPFRRGFHWGGLLDDGGIDQDEYDALGDHHPLKQLDVTDALDDGLITPEELRELWQEFKESQTSDNA